MTREEAAKQIKNMRNACIDYGARGPEVLKEATKMACKALQPWVRTAERAPTEEDGDENGDVLAFGGDREVTITWVKYIERHIEQYQWWMPIPPLPEVTE